MGHIESGRALVSTWIQRILGQGLQNHRAICGDPARDSAGVINTFGKRVAGLEAEARPGIILANARLQRVITGMRARAHHRFGTESSDGPATRVELRVRRESRLRSSVTIRREYAGKMDSRGAHVRSAQLDAADFMVDPQRFRADVTVTKMCIEADRRE